MECSACHTAVDGSQRFCPKCGAMLPADAGPTADPFIGTVIAGKYRIVNLLGEGGMGCVYTGEQQLGTTTRKVAVKTLHKHLSNDPQVKERFQREVSVIAQLQHPNTIQVIDFGTTPDGTLYIVMELVQGRSMADILEKEGAMDPLRAENIMKQICGSLEEAHSQGIVHRDLKPDNIVLCERAGQKDWVEVLDFGIAKRSSEQDEKEQKLTQQGMVLGTPPYMSPEQFTGQPIDNRSDIYALGIMSYEMLTGRLPFDANTPWEWATQHMTVQPKPLEIQPNGQALPPKMRDAVMKAIAKKKEDRFGSPKEFFEAFSTGGAPMSMRGDAMSGAGAMGGTSAMGAAPAPSGGEVGGPPRAKTEIGTPLNFAAGAVTPGPMPYTPPPASGGAPGPYGPAAIPIAPPRDGSDQSSGGGNRGLLIGAAGLIAVLTIGGVVAAMTMGKRKDVEIAPMDTATTPTTTDLSNASASAASNDTPPSTEPSVAPLGGAKPVPGGGGGGTIPHPKPPGSAAPIPTPHPGGGGTTPPSQPSDVQKICDSARVAQKNHFSSAASLAAECRAKGGTL